MALVAQGLCGCSTSFFLSLQSPCHRPLSLTHLSHSCTSTATTAKPSSSSRFKLQGVIHHRLFLLPFTHHCVLLLLVEASAGEAPASPPPISTLMLIPTTEDTDAAAQDYFRVYSDDVNKFQILIPRDWQVGSGEGDGIRSLTAFYPQEPSNSNVSIVITGLGADFTRLESFGKVDAFAENLVSGLDRSWQRPPGVAAKLIDSKAANGLYYIEYTLQNPGESRRHLFSVLGIANNGWYNRLYTLTGQFVEEEAGKYGSTIEKAVASFRFI